MPTANSSVYGPVRSWRAGLSLGVDLLCIDSICSFRCLYCQLGRINIQTIKRKVYVSTEKVMEDIRSVDWRAADIITLSGSGEPTLAENMGAVIHQIKFLTNKPVLVLTNATTLADTLVRKEICRADKIFCKLDAADNETFNRINRPLAGLHLDEVIRGIKSLRGEFTGELAIQLMLTPWTLTGIAKFARILSEINPDEVQLNVARRSIPHRWLIEARGNEPVSVPTHNFKTLNSEEALSIETKLRRLTGLKITSAFHR